MGQGFLVAQLIENLLLETQETLDMISLVRKLESGDTTHSVLLSNRSPK